MPETLTRIHLDLPNHPTSNGETFWAEDLGDGTYELRNSPFFAFGLHFLDVVSATPSPVGPPVITGLVRASGHTTIRVLFARDADDQARQDALDALKAVGATWESASPRLHAVDYAPGIDGDAVRAVLEGLSARGVLGFETTEARVRGSFDAAPA